jgi:hypothetical protein
MKAIQIDQFVEVSSQRSQLTHISTSNTHPEPHSPQTNTSPRPDTKFKRQCHGQNHARSCNTRRPPLRPRPAPKQPAPRQTALHPRDRVRRHCDFIPSIFVAEARHPRLRWRPRLLRRSHLRFGVRGSTCAAAMVSSGSMRSWRIRGCEFRRAG